MILENQQIPPLKSTTTSNRAQKQIWGEIIPNYTHKTLVPKLAFVGLEKSFGIVTDGSLKAPTACSEAIFEKVTLEYY